MEQLQLPATSLSRYLTAYTAMNIISDEGTGDWHTTSVFDVEKEASSYNLAGVHVPSSSLWLGSKDLFDAKPVLLEMGFSSPYHNVWAATHYRAVVDNILYLIERNISDFGSYISLDDWLPEIDEKLRVLSLLEIMNNKNAFEGDYWSVLNQWIEKDINTHNISQSSTAIKII